MVTPTERSQAVIELVPAPILSDEEWGEQEAKRDAERDAEPVGRYALNAYRLAVAAMLATATR